MADRVAVVSPEGQFGTVDSADAEAVERAGGRVLTKKEVAEQAAQEAYDNQSLGMKVATAATMLGPVGYALHPFVRAAGGQLPPEVESYVQGVSSGATGGLASVGMQKLVEAAGGKEAAQAYGKTAETVREAHSGMYTAGQLAGFLGGAVAGGEGAAAKAAIPGAGIGAIGGAAEGAVAQGLSGLAARGAVGRAAATGLSLGARGAVEGALYGAAQQISDDMLGDHELAADKVFAAAGMGALTGGVGGMVLGGAGSLARSGLTGAYEAAGGAVSKGLAKLRGVTEETAGKVGAKAEEAVGDAAAATKKAADAAAEEATSLGKAAAEATGTKPAQEVDSLRKAVRGVTNADVREVAYDQSWRSLNAIKKFAKEADASLPNGTRDVGEVLLRRGIHDVDGGVVNAALGGKPEEMLDRIVPELEIAGQKVGEIADASGARVAVGDIHDAFETVLDPLRKNAGFENIVAGVEQYRDSLYEKLGMVDPTLKELPKGAKVLTSVQDLIAQRRALDKLIYTEGKALSASPRVEELRNVRSAIEELITKSLDEASGQVPGELRAEYIAAKRDYQALKIAKKAAEDSASRGVTNRQFSLGDRITAGAFGTAGSFIGGPIGGLVAGPLAGLASKTVRERGNAAAAVLLYRMAETGSVMQAMARVDSLIERATRGAIRLPEASPATAAAVVRGSPREQAQTAIERVAAIQAHPEEFADRVQRATEPYANTAPQFAGAMTQRMTDAAAFLATKLPKPADKDPFDPHPAPKLTDSQAREFLEYHDYATQPAKFFEDAAKGKITFEGVETARALMPKAFAEFQARTLEHMAETMAKGIRIPFRQRERLGILLDIPAVPSQRPDHMRLLQSNVRNSEQAATASAGAAPPKRPFASKTQPRSSLDRLEGK